MTICWALCSRLWQSSTLGFSSLFLPGVDHVVATLFAALPILPLTANLLLSPSLSVFSQWTSFFARFDSIRIILWTVLLWAACFIRFASSDTPTASSFLHFTTCDAESVQAALTYTLNRNFRPLISNWSVLKSIRASVTLNSSCPVITISLLETRQSQIFVGIVGHLFPCS